MVAKRMVFVVLGMLATIWPTSVLMKMLYPFINAWHESWFHPMDANSMMNAVMQSQAQAIPSPFVEVPEHLIGVDGFLPQLYTFAQLEDRCGNIQYPTESSKFYRVCMLDEHHLQPHCTYAMDNDY